MNFIFIQHFLYINPCLYFGHKNRFFPTFQDELKRGDNPKSIQCYMHDTGCCEEESRGYIKNLIGSTWKKINEDILMNRDYSRDFIKTSINFARISQCMYQYGDGHGIPDRESKARILSLVIEPIPLP